MNALSENPRFKVTLDAFPRDTRAFLAQMASGEVSPARMEDMAKNPGSYCLGFSVRAAILAALHCRGLTPDAAATYITEQQADARGVVDIAGGASCPESAIRAAMVQQGETPPLLLALQFFA